MKASALAVVPRMGSRQLGVVALVPFAGLLSLPVWLAPAPVVLKEFDLADVAQLITMLFVVALLAERALEIFVGTWRGAGATQHEITLQALATEVARLEKLQPAEASGLAETRTALEKAKRQEQQFRCTTRQIVLWAALGLGLLVSGVGLRALETLIDPALSGWSASQGAAFRLVDVVLTSGVIAGGSEGIHRIATVFDNFMNATAKRAKGEA
jgi:hypothetical protein